MKEPIQRVFSQAPWESKVGYCRAIRIGNIIAVTGTTSLTEEGLVYAIGEPYKQTQRCLEIIEKALTQLGVGRNQIIRTRMFVTDISLWEEYGRAHGEFFRDCPPATSMIEVKGLINPAMLIEIEADAVIIESALQAIENK
jgi:isochorismate pyruvate lyase